MSLASFYLLSVMYVCNNHHVNLKLYALFFLRFDINGPGSCLKRYSDPTYFRRASSNLMIQENKKFQTKNYKIKVIVLVKTFFFFNLKVIKLLFCDMEQKKKSSSRSRDMSRLASSMAAANQNAR